MAAEIESIGLSMDTSGVERGIKSLDELAARGPKVEKPMKGVESAATQASKGIGTIGSSDAKGLMATIKAKIAENEQELTNSGRLTESDKLRIKLMAELDAGAKTLTASHKASALALLEKMAAQEKEKLSIKQSIALYQEQQETQSQLNAEYVKRDNAIRAMRQGVSAP